MISPGKQAWEITQATLGLHESHACCRRPWRNGRCPLFEHVLPRHLQIIYEINRRFLEQVAAAYGQEITTGCSACR